VPENPPNLSSNALEIVRAFPVIFAPLDQIKIPDGRPTDEIFVGKYTSFLRGKAAIHHTRLALAKIRRGFWRPIGGHFVLLEDKPPEDDVVYTRDLIRLGSRPALHIYENPNKDDGIPFVCADDGAVHAAYEQLRVLVVPVALMGKPRDLDESCISVRSLPKGPNEWIALMDGVVSVTHTTVPSILGLEKPDLSTSLSRLLGSIQELKIRLKHFHKAGAVTFHYHHSLYSVLLRTEEHISSIKILTEAGMHLIAASLLRPLYELMLTFYVDWLSPSHTYRYLQLASVMTERQWEATCDIEVKDLVSRGLSPADARKIKKAHMQGFRLCSVVAEKARIFPYGEKHHRDIYSFLSDLLHHDFSMNARYTHTLDHGDEAVFHQDATKTILYAADIFVAAILSRIDSDIGSIQPELPPTTFSNHRSFSP
jgi:hypothetical protein